MAKVSFVGMSNIGKSYWAKRLAAEEGYRLICCDDLIAGKLKPFLQQGGYSSDIAGVAAWMDLPCEPRSPLNQKRYLEAEEEVLTDVLLNLPDGDVVIDTTGSVAHMPLEVLQELKRSTLVIHFETPVSMQATMLERFLAEPKPVCWAGYYAPRPPESSAETLARCYPQLLEFRSTLYTRMSDVTIPYSIHRAADFTAFQLRAMFLDATLRYRS